MTLAGCESLQNIDGLANLSNLTTLDLRGCSSLPSGFSPEEFRADWDLHWERANQIDEIRTRTQKGIEESGRPKDRLSMLINYALIEMAMEVPLGGAMFKVTNVETIHHTGTPEHRALIEQDGVRTTYRFRGPTVVGLRPSVARAELRRLHFLKDEVDKAIQQVSGFVELVARREQ